MEYEKKMMGEEKVKYGIFDFHSHEICSTRFLSI